MWATEVRLLLMAAALVAPAAGIAQRVTITEADIEAARRANPTPSDAELAKVPLPAAPRLDRLPPPATRSTPDLGAVARGYDASRGEGAAGVDVFARPQLIVFISFSLPMATLERLVAQAERAGAVLVLRGLTDGSLRATAEQVRDLVGQRRTAIQIDPRPFDRYGVTAVPAFVLTRGTDKGCAGATCESPGAFALASGDVSLDYALEHFRRAAPAFGRDAQQYLERLRGDRR